MIRNYVKNRETPFILYMECTALSVPWQPRMCGFDGAKPSIKNNHG